VHHSSTSTYIPNFIQIEETFCGRTDGRTDIFPPILLGRLLEVDLIIWSWRHWCQLVNKHSTTPRIKEYRRHTARYQPLVSTGDDRHWNRRNSWRKNAVNTGGCTATVANQQGEFAASTHGVEQRRPENGKWNVFTTTTTIITTERNTVNHYDKIYGVFETLTNK